mgnify:CR=1 FL=1|jgi:hypothetical protein
MIEVNEYVRTKNGIIDIGSEVLFERDIQTILTKEQFEANCYKVGGE